MASVRGSLLFLSLCPSILACLPFVSSCDSPPPSADSSCGNGLVEDSETCDDSNLELGDGCDELCTIESSWACGGEPSACEQSCGDGLKAGVEECDGGDFGDATCTSIIGSEATGSLVCSPVCRVTTQQCSSPLCGDGMLQEGEECDDGNLADNDACSRTCNIEICGDGIVQFGEVCDDFNTRAGDGCSSLCQVEEGSDCSTDMPSVCTQLCSNGTVDPGETCDTDQLSACATSCEPGLMTGTASCSACQLDTCEPPLEACNGKDDDCDGTIDEGCELCDNGMVDVGETCDFSGSQACDTTCAPGQMTGTQECTGCQLDTCVAPIEECNGVDDDCDGVVDEGCLDKVILCGSKVSDTGAVLTNPVDPFAVDHAYILESEQAAFASYNCSDVVHFYVYKEQIAGTIPLYRAYGAEFALTVSTVEIEDFEYTLNRVMGFVLPLGAVDPRPQGRTALTLDRFLRTQEPGDTWSYKPITDDAFLDLINYANFPFTTEIRVWDLVAP